MKRILSIMMLLPMLTSAMAQDQSDSIQNFIVGRPYQDFDISAYCAYTRLHPSQYLTDNNWEILCAFTSPGNTSKLDSLGITYSQSQLRLLEAGDLLQNDKNGYSTKMHIFDKPLTKTIREESKQLADSIYHLIKDEVDELIGRLKEKGYLSQAYSLVFSYLLDGNIWSEGKLPTTSRLPNHGTWNGIYWAMFEPRDQSKTGTNGYGQVKVTWTDELGYWPGDNLLIKFANSIDDDGLTVSDEVLRPNLSQWGLTDGDGKITVPVLHPGNGDDVDRLTDSITMTISDAIKNHSNSFANKYGLTTSEEAEVILYHEVMWDLLSILETNKTIEKPGILKGEEVGRQHFGDIVLVVIRD